MLGDRGDLVVLDRDVTYCVYPIPGIDDVATLEHKIVGLLTVAADGRQKANQQENLRQTCQGRAYSSLFSNGRKEIHDKVSLGLWHRLAAQRCVFTAAV